MANFSVDQSLSKAKSYSQKGKIEEARKLYKTILQLFPNNTRAKVGLTKLNVHKNINFSFPNKQVMDEIIEMYDQGYNKQVADKVEIIIKDFPNSFFLWYILGMVCLNLNRFEQAESRLRKAIELNPNFPDGYNNLGIVLLSNNKFEEAIDVFKKAIFLKSDFDEALYNMGIALKEMNFKYPNPDLHIYILKLLDKETFVDPSEIAKAVISLIKCDPDIQKIININHNNEFNQLSIKLIKELSKQPLLIKLMSVMPIPDLELETFLMNIRSFVLFNISKTLNMPDILKFQTAIAHQCFINEYLYQEDIKETEVIVDLEKSIELTLLNNKQPDPIEILCLASYRPLHLYSWCHSISLPKQSKVIIKLQILDYMLEKKLSSEMLVLEKITDGVSSQVRQQYEENPYPRWVSLGLHLKPFTIYEVVNEIKLRLVDKAINSVISPEILVAGCGTGGHPLNTASRFKNSNVLAIDLSIRSLAYAKRRTKEFGVKNIKYMQSDILDLKQLDKQFDIIESSGVLHHMEEPIAGWKVLVNCLKTGGLMRISLYSELGRGHIIEMRNKIKKLGMDSEKFAMKSFRQDIINSEQCDNRRIFLPSSDFYSFSGFRDLLFHVQEHRFTLPQIHDCLSQLGLKFCGFEKSEMINIFKSQNSGDNDEYDLDKWNAFEIANPKSFKSMYQFWCQKIK